ncbi:phage tail protein I [Novosphingobium sp. KA1]|uniref:phage tail protein I n=1 Tax=Novosphingobium sp. (strain KA1) TaxID=164608 RepID=UPI001A8C6FA6|nr:phage tail protein I [Novosphingobium sp. KA1]QSR15624.1 phage tail protein I [Novosphingobium sp. KA1]QSR17479.1 phage tail protein I [Novosphingobium sp. KA1]
MTYASVLPPASTPLEKGLEQVAARLTDLPTPIRSVWSAADCPTTHLPWLAWALAISHWKTEWTIAQKRAEIADAIPYHRRKGSRRAVEEVLARYHASLRIVEWHEASPRQAPYTFEVRAPAAEIPASFLTADTANAIIRDVAVAKPARAHFNFVQTLESQATLFMAAGGMIGAMHRADYAAVHDTSRDWSMVLQTDDGEPIRDEDGNFLEDE